MNIADYWCHLWKIDQILLRLRSKIHIREYIDFDVRASFESRINDQIFYGNTTDWDSFFSASLLSHHIVKYGVHIFPEEIFIVFF